MTYKEAVAYEVMGAGWPQYVSIGWLQTLCAWYFAHRVNRKMRRYEKSMRTNRIVKAAIKECEDVPKG